MENKTTDQGQRIILVGVDILTQMIVKYKMNEAEILSVNVFINTFMLKCLYNESLESARGLLDKQKSLILDKLSKDGWK